MSASPSRRNCVTHFIVLIFSFSVIFLAHATAAQAAGGDIQLSYEDHLLSLKAQEADIKTILLRISDETGVFVRFPNNIEKQISIELKDISLANALKKLLRGLNHAIIYSLLKQNQRTEVSQVYVFQKAASGSTRAYSGSSSNSQSQDVVRRRIENYEKRIQYLNERLSKLDANSPQAERYQRQIQSYQKTLDRLRE